MSVPEKTLQIRTLGVFWGIILISGYGDCKNVGPPAPRFVGVFGDEYDHGEIGRKIDAWTPEDKENLWELSGLYEGDIMVHPEGRGLSKNGLIDPEARWPRGIVPFYIHDKDFDEEGIKVIKGALKEYHEKTCLRFRPYEKSDEDYVLIKGSESGCWSMVGRHGKGQVLNVNNPKCVRHGVVLHELMHAVGFYHQQSAADRDDWVQIHWDNIKDGKEHNFKKYDNATVTDYGVPYDYHSIMHYSEIKRLATGNLIYVKVCGWPASSKLGSQTLGNQAPAGRQLDIHQSKRMAYFQHEETKLGQRKGLTEKDISKIEKMYKEECAKRETEGTSSSGSDEKGFLGWFFE